MCVLCEPFRDDFLGGRYGFFMITLILFSSGFAWCLWGAVCYVRVAGLSVY